MIYLSNILNNLAPTIKDQLLNLNLFEKEDINFFWKLGRGIYQILILH